MSGTAVRSSSVGLGRLEKVLPSRLNCISDYKFTWRGFQAKFSTATVMQDGIRIHP